MAEEATAPVEQTAPASETISTTNETKAPEAELNVSQPEQNTNTITLTDEQAKFFKANGGLEKVFPKIKDAISNPRKDPVGATETAKTATEPAKTVEQPSGQTNAPTEPIRTPEGYITPQEFYAQQYFNSLAGDEKYATIADQIRSGEVLKEMSAFNISALDSNGNINDAMVRRFLDMKAQTVPAKAPETATSSATPTVNYTSVEGDITDRDTAFKILGEAGNPQHDAAKAFLQKQIFGTK